MHFSCIGTLSFLVGTLLWLCFSISPSFSLSLSNRLHMVPKRKSTLSRNPLCSGTSSSDPTPTHVRFRDEKAHKDFSENFSKCGVHSKCHVILSDFSDTTLPIVIHYRGWESLWYPWVVPPWSCRSSTPICTVSIPLYLSLPRLLEVHVL